MSPMKPPATGKGARKPIAAGRSPRRPPGTAATRRDRPAAARTVHPRNKLNDLTGEEWLFRSRSVLQTAYPSAYGHARRKAHGANKPPQLMKELIEFFTKPGGRVLDPFAGVGGTLIGASLAGRRAIGIEINPAWREIYEKVCAEEGIAPQTFIVGDCLEALAPLEAGSVDFVATDPPYNRQFERTMCNGVYDNANRRTDFDAAFSDLPEDFSNSASYAEFLERMERLFGALLPLLRPDGYAAVILRNAYQDGEYMMTQADVAGRARRPVQRNGRHAYRFFLKGEIIWYQAGSRLRPYGYPYAFVPNIAHQTIVILRKERMRPQAVARPARPSGSRP
jgi:DNA modification methylase